MPSRRMRRLWVVLSGLGGLVLGTATAALGTGPGRDVVMAFALEWANRALDGRVTIEGYDGSLVRGLEIEGLRITDPDSVPLLRVGALRVQYRLQDLASGRIVLGRLMLADAEVTLVEGPDGRFNFQRVLRLGDEGGGDGLDPLIAFNDVLVEDLQVAIRTGSGGTDGREERRVTVDLARLPYLRISSPLPGQTGILAQIAQIDTRLSEPALDIRDAEGEVTVRGDSVHLALNQVRLPATRGSVLGVLVPAEGGLRMDLRAQLPQLLSDDLQGLVPLFPDGFTGRAEVAVETPSVDVLQFDASGLELRTPEGGRLTGRLAMVLGPGERWQVLAADVRTDAFPVHHLEVLIDSIPFRGTLTGTTTARGPAARLETRIDWRFRDAQVESRPETRLVGNGLVAIGPPEGLVFDAFGLSEAAIPLATVRVLVPVVELRGRLDGAGTLRGPLRNAEFSGTLRHVPDTLGVTVARGTARIDARTDTIGVWTDLTFDSLRLDAWQRDYPAIPLDGAWAGTLRLAGFLDSLVFQGDLAGSRGRLDGRGVFTVAPARVGVRDLDLAFERLAIEPVRAVLPGTRLTGTARGRARVDSGAAPEVDLAVTLADAVIGGVTLDSARARIRSADSVLLADTLVAWLTRATLRGGGGIGFRAPRRDSLALEVEVDSLGALMPLLERLAGAEPGTLADTVDGRITGTLAVRGALDTFALALEAEGRRLRWDDLVAPHVRVDGRWTGGTRTLAVDLTADSVALERLAFAAIEARARGRPDSLGWFGRSRIGRDAAVLAGGTFVADSLERTVRFDSLAVLLASSVWFLQRGATVALRDTAVTMRDVVVAPPSGASRVTLDGVLPLRGPGDLHGRIERFPLQDLWALVQYDPREAGGEISGTLALTGTARAPVIEASLALADAVISEFRAPRLEVTLGYRDRRLQGTGGLWRLGQQVMQVTLDLPMDLALRGARERQLPGPISVRARADGVDLAFLEAIYPQTRRTGGELFADFGIGGTWERPQLTGEVRVENGAATLPALGVRHENLNGRIELVGDTIHVRRFSVSSGGGTAELGGYIRLEGLSRPRLALTLSARDFRAMDVPDVLAATVSGEARLRGPVFGATLSGQATVPRGVLWFGDIVQKDIINLEDTLFADVVDPEELRRQGLGAAFQNVFLDSLRIDSLSLTMGGDMWLRSSEANIGLTGQVLVNKTGGQYRMDGTLGTPRGTYRLPLAGTVVREFTVTRGEVRYFGTPDLNAGLDIDARHPVRTVRGDVVVIFVHIGGTIESPRLELSSDIQPPVSDTEIISYLLVGAPSVQAGQQGLGARAVQQVASRVTGQLGNALIADLSLPFDYIELRPEFEQGLGGEIAVGKQLGERFFLSLSPRICPQQELTYQNLGASLEFRMSREFRLSASADPVGSCRLLADPATGTARYQIGLDLLWEKNY